VAEPVLVSDVRPEVRVKMMDEILDNNGYFMGGASYELVKGKNKKKAKILYRVTTGPEYMLDSIILPTDSCHLTHVIDSVARRIKYLKPGVRYSSDSLSTVRTRIANSLRNRGYYFFRPEYIEYLADSTINPRHIALKMKLASNIPAFALKRYRTGKVTTYIYRNEGGGTPDTIHTRVGDVVQMKPSRLRTKVIPENVAFRPGKYFSVRDMDRTQTYLSRLSIFNAINIEVTPDTASTEPLLDVDIACTFDRPLEASIEVNASSKSNSYLGPGVILGVTNRNVFGGGEQLSVNLTGAYEWQTGRNRSSVFNSYEVGLNASLAFPRLLAPKFIPRLRRAANWTRVSLGADLLNRPHYFKMAQFNASFGYDWRSKRYIANNLTVFKLTYTNLMHTTHAFDSIMDANPAIAQSFKSQFIPQMSYSMVYDRAMNRNNTINIQATVTEAGNVFWALWEACGKKGEKELFGNPFSQFIKGTAQVVYGRRLGGSHWLMSRVMVGAAHAYGNSSQVPYSEQFYCGGANSVRAFTVRSLGPGSYHTPGKSANDYFDQTGTFKFEANIEYRFPILGPLHGAVFMDAGNVWLLKDDPQRPGGTLKASSFLRELALGTGAGLRFDIGMLVVRADLGIGIHAPYDTGRSGYYNMTSFKNSLAFHLAIGYPF
ncbi:MAG TPA: BamA/TamA family outer membrane protein, partial [Muribaculaceae bacterium]|nr:BamA/TamA family outer membrane protein [Muribaculaceae bacterium]